MSGTGSRAWIEVDLDALVDNARTVARAAGARLLPIVKANAYGVGAVAVSAALEQLAESTKGFFYEAASAEALQRVYQDMGSSIGYRTKAQEIGQWFVGFGLLFALGAAAMSLLWTSRLP